MKKEKLHAPLQEKEKKPMVRIITVSSMVMLIFLSTANGILFAGGDPVFVNKYSITVSLLSPQDNAILNSDSIHIDFSLSDVPRDKITYQPSIIFTVWAILDGIYAARSDVHFDLSRLLTPQNYTMEVTNITEGMHTLRVAAVYSESDSINRHFTELSGSSETVQLLVELGQNPDPESRLTVATQLAAKTQTIFVPDDYSTVQAAVANASPGDTVLVRSGKYNGGIVIDKPLTIKGENANSTSIIGGETANDLGLTSVANRKAPENSPVTSTLAETGRGTAVEIQPLSIIVQPANFIPPLTFAIIVNSNDVNISGFTILGGDRAIFSSQGNRLQICQNILGTCILGGSNNTIANNSRIGLTISGSQNLIANNSGGLVVSSSNSTIIQNSLTGFALQNAYSNIILNNTLSGSNMGLWIGSSINSGPPTCSYNLFAGNKIENCGLWGILMGAGSYNVFFENIIENTGTGLDHDGYGLALGGNHLVAEHNLFLHNVFVNNSKNFGVNWEVTGTNSFDDGKEGNYWDDYFIRYPSATEVGNSGTGNIPYTLTETNNIDNHPLLAQPAIQGKMPILPEPWASLLPKSTAMPNPSPSASSTPLPSTSTSSTPTLSPIETSLDTATSNFPSPLSPLPSASPSLTFSPSPQVPEFPQWVIAALLLSVLSLIVVKLRKNRR